MCNSSNFQSPRASGAPRRIVVTVRCCINTQPSRSGRGKRVPPGNKAKSLLLEVRLSHSVEHVRCLHAVASAFLVAIEDGILHSQDFRQNDET